MKDIFISHAWGKDLLGRDNHKRCKLIADNLLSKGYTVWFDSYDLYGNIDSTIMKGINNCKVVIICLTKKYCDKINNSVINQLPNDNCYKEWNYSLFKQKIIIPVLMEPCMHEIYLKNDGIIPMYLNSLMFMDFTENIEDDITMLYKTLKSHNVYNTEEKIFYNGVSNSFSDFIKSFTNTNVKSLSPRIIHKIKNKYKDKYKDNYNYNYKIKNNHYWKKLKSFSLKNFNSKNYKNPKSPNSPKSPKSLNSPRSPMKFFRQSPKIKTIIKI
jgi:hypothetical protein